MKKPSRPPLSYAASGVDSAAKDEVLGDLESTLATNDKRVLSSMDAFASLFDARFPGYEHPVLVMKTEEPGSKQLLAFQHDRVESVCEDMINHLINDIVVMGAVPLAAQDAVICGKLDKKIVARIVKAVAAACRAQGCVLTGGETSEQPGVIPAGTYILSANVVGIVEKKNIIDGSHIRAGDVILAVASNGLHTNGYSLVRRLLAEQPELAKKNVKAETFIDAILKPHLCYFAAVKELAGDGALRGMAHITGTGMRGNIERIMPKNCDARIDLARVKVLPVFGVIRDAGTVADDEMLRTYNMGVGLTLIVKEKNAERIATHVRAHGHDCYAIGSIAKGSGKVTFEGKLRW